MKKVALCDEVPPLYYKKDNGAYILLIWWNSLLILFPLFIKSPIAVEMDKIVAQ